MLVELRGLGTRGTVMPGKVMLRTQIDLDDVPRMSNQIPLSEGVGAPGRD